MMASIGSFTVVPSGCCAIDSFESRWSRGKRGVQALRKATGDMCSSPASFSSSFLLLHSSSRPNFDLICNSSSTVAWKHSSHPSLFFSPEPRHLKLLVLRRFTLQCSIAEEFAYGGTGLKTGGIGLWIRRKRRWKLEKIASAGQRIGVVCEEKGAVQEFAERISPETSARRLSDNASTSFDTSERLFVRDNLRDINQKVYRDDLQDVVEAESANAPVTGNYIGVDPFRGRFKVELEKDGVVHALIFSRQEEAAKAYDKSAYKLFGAVAKTNFKLTEEEKLEVNGMEWEDLLLHMQLKDLNQSAPRRLGFPGVCYKDKEGSWQATIRHNKQVYVGRFPTIIEATKAYNLAAYKLHGRDALLSRPLSSSERKELMDLEWDVLADRLGLKVRARRIRESSGYRGVHLRPSGFLHASFSHKGYNFYLGTFNSKAAAAKAYDLFASKLLGKKARLNSELLPEEEEFLSTISVSSLRNHLASQAVMAPKILPLGARGARLVQGQWEVFFQNSRKDRIYTTCVSSEQEAVKIHDLAVHKLHNGLARTYEELTMSERQEVESADWKSLVSKFDLRQMPSYHGVNRLVSGLWQSYIRQGGTYLPVGTFDSAETAARASDMCAYKLLRKNAILNFPLSEGQKREVDAVDWGTLVSRLREEQRLSAVLSELGETSSLYQDLPREKKWMLLLCHEQILQQQMARRAPKVGRQLVVGNPSLAAQFSHLNRRADGSPMLVDEVMEGCNAHLIWQCPCGNIVLKAPMGLLKTKQVTCKMPECTIKPPKNLRMKKKDC